MLMLYYSRDRDEIFVRIAADPNHLRQVAEMIRYQLELKPWAAESRVRALSGG